jgi:hypothetical protein
MKRAPAGYCAACHRCIPYGSERKIMEIHEYICGAIRQRERALDNGACQEPGCNRLAYKYLPPANIIVCKKHHALYQKAQVKNL